MSSAIGRLRHGQSTLAHVGKDRTQVFPRQALGVDRSQTAAVSSRPQPREVVIAEELGLPPRSLVYSTSVHPGILNELHVDGVMPTDAWRTYRPRVSASPEN